MKLPANYRVNSLRTVVKVKTAVDYPTKGLPPVTEGRVVIQFKGITTGGEVVTFKQSVSLSLLNRLNDLGFLDGETVEVRVTGEGMQTRYHLSREDR